MRVPEMIIQVGGSISFAPETEGAAAKWLSDDTRHMLAELDPKPDQVTVTINTSQMNVVEHWEDEDVKGTSMEDPEVFNAYKEMTVPAQPGWAEEHIRRLNAAGIQSAFQCYNINSFESVERLMRRGIYKGPLVMNWVAIGGGMDAPNIYNLANFVRATPDGAVLTVESSMRNVLPVNMMGIAMGLHVRCGIEDNLWNQSRTKKMSTVEQIEQLVRISREFGRPIATAQQAREISKIGVFYDTVEEIAAGQRLRAESQRRRPGLPAQGRLSHAHGPTTTRQQRQPHVHHPRRGRRQARLARRLPDRQAASLVCLCHDLRADAVRLHRPAGDRVAVPAHQERMEPERQAARRAGLHHLHRGGRRRHPGGAAGRPREPREEHRRDGDGLERWPPSRACSPPTSPSCSRRARWWVPARPATARWARR